MVFAGPHGEAVQARDGLGAHECEGAPHLQLLDIFSEVAACHPLVNLFVAREGAKFFDARFHIVARDLFAPCDGFEIDCVFHAFVGGNGLVRHGQSEVTLRLEDGDPEFAFEHNASRGRPHRLHCGGGVTVGEDVDNGGVGLAVHDTKGVPAPALVAS